MKSVSLSTMGIRRKLATFYPASQSFRIRKVGLLLLFSRFNLLQPLVLRFQPLLLRLQLLELQQLEDARTSSSKTKLLNLPSRI